MNSVERVTPVARVSASLERMTAGARAARRVGGVLPAHVPAPACPPARSPARPAPPTPATHAAGRDPDRHMVLPDGAVINEELNEPPREAP